MLTELHIQNFAIIDKLDLRFGPGLIILTGETGAGKSIILDAVVMLIGGKADATFIRTDSDASFVEGVFQLRGPEKEAVHEILKREELMDDLNYVVLMREVRREGRNVARVNGRTVNVSLLKELGSILVDIHGQAEHLSLLDSRAHLGLLDRYAEVERPLSDYRQTYHTLQNLRRELSDLRRAQADAERRIDMLTYQVEEIEAARLKPGEEEELRQERDRLANAESLAKNAQEALAILDEGSPEMPAASDLLGQAAQALGALAKIDLAQSELANQAEVLLDEKVATPVGDGRAAIGVLANWLRSRYAGARIVGVGHRVVHGGPRFSSPVVITREVLTELSQLVPLAPLHQPHNLAPIRAIMHRPLLDLRLRPGRPLPRPPGVRDDGGGDERLRGDDRPGRRTAHPALLPHGRHGGGAGGRRLGAGGAPSPRPGVGPGPGRRHLALRAAARRARPRCRRLPSRPSSRTGSWPVSGCGLGFARRHALVILACFGRGCGRKATWAVGTQPLDQSPFGVADLGGNPASELPLEQLSREAQHRRMPDGDEHAGLTVAQGAELGVHLDQRGSRVPPAKSDPAAGLGVRDP